MCGPGAMEASGNQPAGIMSSPLTGLVTDKQHVTGCMHNSPDGSLGPAGMVGHSSHV